MSGFLLDTNVVSEMTKRTPHARVVAFLTERDDCWLSVIIVHELEFGIQLLPQGRRRLDLEATLRTILAEYESHILPLGRQEMEWAATFRARARRAGRALDLGDALIAGTAKVRELAIATRNTRDFEYLDLDVANPWETL